MTRVAFGVTFTGWGPSQDVHLASMATAGFSIVRSDIGSLEDATVKAQACHSHGLRLLPLARDTSLAPLAGHPGIAGFEVWNEPNLIQPLPRNQWIALVRSVNGAGCVPTISGGVADNNDYSGWVKAVRPLPAGVKLGIHPYVFGVSSVKEAHSLDRSREIWVTEFGAGKIGITESQRATILRSQLKAMMKYAKALIVYSWSDPSFSIADSSGVLLPSGEAISDLIKNQP